MIKTKTFISREQNTITDIDTKINDFCKKENITKDRLIDIKYQYVQTVDTYTSAMIIYSV